MKEKLIIKNFAGIDYLEIELNKINILIGPQASGKSITAKLFYYFKSYFKELKEGIENNKSEQDIEKAYLNLFVKYFPIETWPNNSFLIEYFIGKEFISINKEYNKILNINLSNNIKSLFNKAKVIYGEEFEKNKIIDRGFIKYSPQIFVNKFDELIEAEISPKLIHSQYFIPAGRSFFSTIQSSIFSIINSNQRIDPLIIDFGSFYEGLKYFISSSDFDYMKEESDKKFDEILVSILNSKYLREKDVDFLVHSDHRKVNLINASSGQQEVLPLLLVFKSFAELPLLTKKTILYIEEPEAHLFPNAQNGIVQLLARIFNSANSEIQIIITTHSPYILSSFNNLMYAGSLDRKLDKSKASKLNKIIPKEERIDPKLVSAYSLDLGGKKKNLIDKETGLISQNYLDDVSNKISTEFGKLLDLEF